MSTLADICLLFKTRATGKALLLGKFPGAMYFGTLIANSSQAHLPDLRLPLIGRIPGERIVQAGVLAVAAAWLYTGLVPGSILAAAAAVAAAMGMMWFAKKVTSRGWIQMLGIGLKAAICAANSHPNVRLHFAAAPTR